MEIRKEAIIETYANSLRDTKDKNGNVKHLTPYEKYIAAYNIVKNTSYAILKNKLIFKLNDCIIDLDKLGFEYSLSDEMIKNLEIVSS